MAWRPARPNASVKTRRSKFVIVVAASPWNVVDSIRHPPTGRVRRAANNAHGGVVISAAAMNASSSQHDDQPIPGGGDVVLGYCGADPCDERQQRPSHGARHIWRHPHQRNSHRTACRQPAPHRWPLTIHQRRPKASPTCFKRSPDAVVSKQSPPKPRDQFALPARSPPTSARSSPPRSPPTVSQQRHCSSAGRHSIGATTCSSTPIVVITDHLLDAEADRPPAVHGSLGAVVGRKQGNLWRRHRP